MGSLSATQSLQRTVNEITSKLDINDQRVLELLKQIQSGIKELESLQRQSQAETVQDVLEDAASQLQLAATQVLDWVNGQNSSPEPEFATSTQQLISQSFLDVKEVQTTLQRRETVSDVLKDAADQLKTSAKSLLGAGDKAPNGSSTANPMGQLSAMSTDMHVALATPDTATLTATPAALTLESPTGEAAQYLSDYPQDFSQAVSTAGAADAVSAPLDDALFTTTAVEPTPVMQIAEEIAEGVAEEIPDVEIFVPPEVPAVVESAPIFDTVIEAAPTIPTPEAIVDPGEEAAREARRLLLEQYNKAARPASRVTEQPRPEIQFKAPDLPDFTDIQSSLKSGLGSAQEKFSEFLSGAQTAGGSVSKWASETAGELQNGPDAVIDRFSNLAKSVKLPEAPSLPSGENLVGGSGIPSFQGAPQSIPSVSLPTLSVDSVVSGATGAVGSAAGLVRDAAVEAVGKVSPLVQEAPGKVWAQLTPQQQATVVAAAEGAQELWEKYGIQTVIAVALVGAGVRWYKNSQTAGYAGNIDPETAYAALNDVDQQALLIDTRPEDALLEDGVCELRRGALGRGAWLPKVVVEGTLRQKLRQPLKVEYALMAEAAKGLKQATVQTQFLVMDQQGEQSREIARAIQALGYPAYVVDGGFSAWDAMGLPIDKEAVSYEATTALRIQKAAEEAGEKVVEVRDRALQPANVAAIALVTGSTAATVYNYHLVLQYLAVVLPSFTLALQVAKYDSRDELIGAILNSAVWRAITGRRAPETREDLRRELVENAAAKLSAGLDKSYINRAAAGTATAFAAAAATQAADSTKTDEEAASSEAETESKDDDSYDEVEEEEGTMAIGEKEPIAGSSAGGKMVMDATKVDLSTVHTSTADAKVTDSAADVSPEKSATEKKAVEGSLKTESTTDVATEKSTDEKTAVKEPLATASAVDVAAAEPAAKQTAAKQTAAKELLETKDSEFQATAADPLDSIPLGIRRPAPETLPAVKEQVVKEQAASIPTPVAPPSSAASSVAPKAAKTSVSNVDMPKATGEKVDNVSVPAVNGKAESAAGVGKEQGESGMGSSTVKVSQERSDVSGGQQ